MSHVSTTVTCDLFGRATWPTAGNAGGLCAPLSPKFTPKIKWKGMAAGFLWGMARYGKILKGVLVISGYALEMFGIISEHI